MFLDKYLKIIKLNGSTLLLIFIILGHFQANSQQQEIKKAGLKLSLVPGLGSSGPEPLNYEHNIEINVFSGISFGNRGISISGISSYNTNYLYGIQLSGIANITGAAQKDVEKTKGGYNKDQALQFNAFQFAGISNVSFLNGKGFQLSTIMNTSKSLSGMQLTGIMNFIEENSTGIQLAGISNVTLASMYGIQTSLLYNHAQVVNGVQISAINQAKKELNGIQVGFMNLSGNYSKDPKISRRNQWSQIGIINLTNRNGRGGQIGLINSGNQVGSYQIGLINISHSVPDVPIGLLNVSKNTYGFLRISYSSLFDTNIEFGTGSKKLMSNLIIGTDLLGDSQDLGFGYAFGIIKYRGSNEDVSVMNLDVRVIQMMKRNALSFNSNLITGSRLTYGINPFPGYPFRLFFVGYIGINVHLVEDSQIEVPLKLSGPGKFSTWPDFGIGIHMNLS